MHITFVFSTSMLHIKAGIFTTHLDQKRNLLFVQTENAIKNFSEISCESLLMKYTVDSFLNVIKEGFCNNKRKKLKTNNKNKLFTNLFCSKETPPVDDSQ